MNQEKGLGLTDTSILGFPADLFAARRGRVHAGLDGGAMVLPAAPVLHRSRDIGLRYRADNELFYVTGLTEPEAVAVLRGDDHEERFTLFVRERDEEAELWSGDRLGTAGAQDAYGADAVHPVEELAKHLPELLDGSDRVLFRLGRQEPIQALVLESLSRARLKGARRGTGPRAVVDPGVVLDDLRLIKDEHELSRIRAAATLSVDAFRSALANARPGMGEWELEALLDQAFRVGGGSGPAYPTIVGSGVNACVLHYVDNARRIDEQDLVLVDAGAEVDLYAADITRTFPASGRYSCAQRDVYTIVAAANRAAMKVVRPGSTVADVHAAGVGVLVDGLVELGVLEGDRSELIEEEAFKPYFPHQTSHWLGLDVHDVGDYARDDESRVLEAGMVLTVEPGLYFRADAADGSTAEKLSGIGVRVEDDVLVTESGYENLTAALPVGADEIEAMIG